MLDPRHLRKRRNPETPTSLSEEPSVKKEKDGKWKISRGGVLQESDVLDAAVVDVELLPDCVPPGPSNEWNPSGLAESHLKKLRAGFYGWENQALIRVSKSSLLYYHFNQDTVKMVHKERWLPPQKKYIELCENEVLQIGGRWVLKYELTGCSCGSPWQLRQKPVTKPIMCRCGNYCCQREWEEESTL
eukprot:NODE_1801_length_753_cov_201.122159_g1400_i0.p1 GENE.NODE_1801_length_753_cov_201.122159_g1400_i0~~NODE_1801_length_753_cov_201.122159_g1400_i0.p1  ORF type:complete len:188 (-),score=17.59 NODE_1801_length_753_cov_201.122159_g1400_i0:131-694(-)